MFVFLVWTTTLFVRCQGIKSGLQYNWLTFVKRTETTLLSTVMTPEEEYDTNIEFLGKLGL